MSLTSNSVLGEMVFADVSSSAELDGVMPGRVVERFPIHQHIFVHVVHTAVPKHDGTVPSIAKADHSR